MATDAYAPLKQDSRSLACSADGMVSGTAPAEAPSQPASGAAASLIEIHGLRARASGKPPVGSCQQQLTLTFFFDGTGNNIDADVGTLQHSNVAKLFQAHLVNSDVEGRYSFYAYGIGTYFKEIGDPGNTVTGLGLGDGGQERIDWAFRKFEEVLAKAEARAQNPSNRIVGIRVAVFGFSRGATQARAFCRELQQRCDLKQGRYFLKHGGHPVELYFLGLFDTVAAVGVPMSANNTPGATTAGWYALKTTLDVRAQNPTSGIRHIAFGEPGADPAPGSANGHLSYGNGLAIVPMVQRCLHLVAAHEIRNSFPLDTALDRMQYPPGVTEMVYPGAHSDVGGGYQPGEGGRSLHHGDMLSLVPLLVMHAEAVKCGVPLRALSSLRNTSKAIAQSFALDPESQSRYTELLDHWQHYMRATAASGNVGRQFNAHMQQYYRWRFHAIARARAATGRNEPSVEASSIGPQEARFKREREAQAKVVAQRKKELDAAAKVAEWANERYMNAMRVQVSTGIAVRPDLPDAREEAEERVEIAREAYLREKAKLDTHADDSALLTNWTEYDRRLLADAQAIDEQLKRNPGLKLRPHYRGLHEAYLDEFVRGKGLRDAKLIAFFDRYVHDSLARFAKDATLPSDPRVLYVGGDRKLRSAQFGEDPTEPLAA